MPMTSRKPLARKVFAAAVAAVALFAGTSVTAEAATPRNGKCETGEVCFYYNSNYQGSVSDFNTSVADYGTTQPKCYDFKGEGAGKGKCIKNQVASVRNLSSQPVTIYYNSNYNGSRASQTIAAGASANLNSTMKNNNASHKFGAAASTPSAGYASPVPKGVKISAGWYYPRGKFHGAVDFAYRGSVFSACNGVVDTVRIDGTYPNSNAKDKAGTTNYVWVKCDGGESVRMGYAHFYEKDLPAHIKVGARVKAGQYLFPVGNQGNSTGYHLHFEVRKNGKQIKPLEYLRSKGVTVP